MALLLVVLVLLMQAFINTSLIDLVYTLVSYTYGPLLGLFAFVLLNKKQQRQSRWIFLPCVLSPLLCYLLSALAQQYMGYHFGYELLVLNGLLTYLGIRISVAY